METKIIQKIQDALKAQAIDNNLSYAHVNLVVKPTGKIFSAGKEVDICKTFKLSMMESLFVVGKLKSMMASVAKGYDSALVFTKQEDFYPAVYLQEGGVAKKELTIKDFVK